MVKMGLDIATIASRRWSWLEWWLCWTAELVEPSMKPDQLRHSNPNSEMPLPSTAGSETRCSRPILAMQCRTGRGLGRRQQQTFGIAYLWMRVPLHGIISLVRSSITTGSAHHVQVGSSIVSVRATLGQSSLEKPTSSQVQGPSSGL